MDNNRFTLRRPYVRLKKNPTRRRACEASLQCWINRCKFHSPQTQLTRPQAPLTPSDWSALYRGRGSPVMGWILLKANNGQQASGVGDKRFFRFKRNAYHLWTAIIRHRLNDITHQQVMRFNQGSKFANIFKVHLKHPQCFGTHAQPSHFLSNTPVTKYQSSLRRRVITGGSQKAVRVSRRMDCRIGVIKFYDNANN